jgi:hypothetical protein
MVLGYGFGYMVWGELAAIFAHAGATLQCRKTLGRQISLGETIVMRTIFGFLLGVAVTIGAAYVRDTSIAGSATAKPLVNWEEFGGVTRDAMDAARNQWNKLTQKN